MISPSPDPHAVLRRRLKALVRLLPAIEARGATLGEWHDPHQHGQMAYFLFNQLGTRFWDTGYKHGWVLYDFDWGPWNEGKHYLTDLEALARAPLADLERLMTVHLRHERFCEGHLQSVLESGHLVVLLRRLQEILEDLPPPPRRRRIGVATGPGGGVDRPRPGRPTRPQRPSGDSP